MFGVWFFFFSNVVHYTNKGINVHGPPKHPASNHYVSFSTVRGLNGVMFKGPLPPRHAPREHLGALLLCHTAPTYITLIHHGQQLLLEWLIPNDWTSYIKNVQQWSLWCKLYIFAFCDTTNNSTMKYVFLFALKPRFLKKIKPWFVYQVLQSHGVTTEATTVPSWDSICPNRPLRYRHVGKPYYDTFLLGCFTRGQTVSLHFSSSFVGKSVVVVSTLQFQPCLSS